jgi:prephenate dehydratase
MTRVAYLGPPGTFTEEAALRYQPEAELVPFPTEPAAVAAVSRARDREQPGGRRHAHH